MSEDDEVARFRTETLQRIEILDALLSVIDRRVEVFDTIAASDSADSARGRIADLLGVSMLGATAILDLQARRFAQLEVSRIRTERDRLSGELNG